MYELYGLFDCVDYNLNFCCMICICVELYGFVKAGPHAKQPWLIESSWVNKF